MKTNGLFELITNPFNNLNKVFRYSNTTLIERESTAEHEILMQCIALYLYDKYPFLNIRDICYRILVHDMDEALAGMKRKGIISPVGDIPRDIKYYNDDTYNTIKYVVDNNIQDNINNKQIFKDICNSKGDDTFEAIIVSILDMLQSIIKLRRECYLQGFDYIILYRLDECLENYKARINNYKDYFDTNEKKLLYKEFKNIYKIIFNEINKKNKGSLNE